MHGRGELSSDSSFPGAEERSSSYLHQTFEWQEVSHRELVKGERRNSKQLLSFPDTCLSKRLLIRESRKAVNPKYWETTTKENKELDAKGTVSVLL